MTAHEKFTVKIAPPNGFGSSKIHNSHREPSARRRVLKRAAWGFSATFLMFITLSICPLPVASQTFHDAPSSARTEKNPYAGRPSALTSGAKLYAANCSSCHGPSGHGTANIPSLARETVQSASD